jgi:xanthine dehydrogenase accessory factor
MRIVIRGAGDLASGIATRLVRAGAKVVMLDVAEPLAVRRTVAFCEAVRQGTQTVEGIVGRLVAAPEEALALPRDEVAVLVDPAGATIPALAPDVLVDAILAKYNVGTTKDMAPVVIGVGPGFTAPQDCHCVVETMRGHTCGRVIYEGQPIPNTGVPGNIGGFTTERVLRAPVDGVFTEVAHIGDVVEKGQVLATVDGVPMPATIDGVLRGLLPSGTRVTKGLKSGDIDPRAKVWHCFTVSDKALSIAGGVLEAVCHFCDPLAGFGK